MYYTFVLYTLYVLYVLYTLYDIYMDIVVCRLVYISGRSMGRSPRWGAVAIVARYNLFELRFIAQSHTNNPQRHKDKTSPLPGG